MMVAILYVIFLFSGYGITIGSTENVAGLGLDCQYITARGKLHSQYLHSDSGLIGISQCPILKKFSELVE